MSAPVLEMFALPSWYVFAYLKTPIKSTSRNAVADMGSVSIGVPIHESVTLSPGRVACDCQLRTDLQGGTYSDLKLLFDRLRRSHWNHKASMIKAVLKSQSLLFPSRCLKFLLYRSRLP